MEIELEVGQGLRKVWASLAICVIVGLTILGRAVTPPGGGVLTPSDWQLRNAERAYVTELARLRQEATGLADILDRAPDPVRAGLDADRVAQLTRSGHPGLALQRQALAEAADDVRLWAMGGGARDAAEQALERAVSLLQGAGRQ
jgi:hypothetical protein